MDTDRDMDSKVVVEEEEPPHVIGDTAKNPRNNITKINLILFMRTPLGEKANRLALTMPVLREPVESNDPKYSLGNG